MPFLNVFNNTHTVQLTHPCLNHFGGQPVCVAIRQLNCTGNMSNSFVENLPINLLGGSRSTCTSEGVVS